MLYSIRSRALSLLRTSRVAQVTVAILTICLIIAGVFVNNSKIIYAHIDGKTVRIRTIFGTVGQALAHSNLESYPEDVVIPSRETKVTEGLAVEVTRSKPVRLSVDEQTFVTRTPSKTVGEALADLSERYGLQIKNEDDVNISRSEAVTDQMEIKVQRTIPVLVHADGKTIDTYVVPRTVSDVLKNLGIVLGMKDKVSLALDHVLVPHDQLSVVRVVERVETVKSDIPYQSVIQAADYPVGLPDQVVSRGLNGLQEQTVKLTLEDGKEVDREILSQRVLKAPANQVISRGSQTSVSRGGETIQFKRAYLMRATAYCIPGGTTKTGASVCWGIVAVDPRVIPLGANVYVDGYGKARALDTGGLIKGNRIDLYMNSEEAASSYGVRNVMVYLQ